MSISQNRYKEILPNVLIGDLYYINHTVHPDSVGFFLGVFHGFPTALKGQFRVFTETTFWGNVSSNAAPTGLRFFGLHAAINIPSLRD